LGINTFMINKRIFHHLDLKEMKRKQQESLQSIRAKEKYLKEEAKIQKEIFDSWKSDWRKDLLDEGMTTQTLTGILPPTGDADLTHLPLGLTGGTRPENGDRLGLIDYDGSLDLAESTLKGVYLLKICRYPSVSIQHSQHNRLLLRKTPFSPCFPSALSHLLQHFSNLFCVACTLILSR